MITELELVNFRGFSRLKLTGLGPVNLVVGMNNVGKTSLLEAVSLLGGEGWIGKPHSRYREVPDHQRDSYFKFLIKEGTGMATGSRIWAQLEAGGAQSLHLHEGSPPELPHQPMKGFKSRGRLGQVSYTSFGDTGDFKCLTASCLKSDQDRRLTLLSKLLESGEREEQLIQLLRALDDRVDAIRILSENGHSYIAIGFGRKQRIPVSHAGQGMDRVVGIFSEILGGKADVVCIDEIENGLHHTALRRIWEGIAEIARTLGVQLFITTHSRECLEAAHHVFSQREPYALRVVQLYRVKEEIDGRVLGRDLIEAAVESEIEVR